MTDLNQDNNVVETPSTEVDVDLTSDINDVLDVDESGESEIPEAAEPTTPTTKEPVQPATPAVAAPPTPPAAPEPVQAPQPAPVQPPTEAAAPATQQPQTPQPTPDIGTLRTNLMGEIEQRYKSLITEEDKMALLTEPENVLPKLISNLFLDVFQATYGNILQQIPMILTSYNQARTNQETSQKEFFNRWPALNKPKYLSQVGRIITNYMGQNPKATRKQIIEEAGGLAHVLLKVPFEQPAPAAAAPVQPAPAATPFRPANPGGSAPATPPASVRNPFEVLAEEFENLD